MAGTAFAGFLLIEFLGVRTSLWITAAINLAIGAAAISLGRRDAVVEPSREPGENPDFPRDHLRTLALVLLALSAFASLIDEIALKWVLDMGGGGTTFW